MASKVSGAKNRYGESRLEYGIVKTTQNLQQTPQDFFKFKRSTTILTFPIDIGLLRERKTFVKPEFYLFTKANLSLLCAAGSHLKSLQSYT